MSSSNIRTEAHHDVGDGRLQLCVTCGTALPPRTYELVLLLRGAAAQVHTHAIQEHCVHLGCACQMHGPVGKLHHPRRTHGCQSSIALGVTCLVQTGPAAGATTAEVVAQGAMRCTSCSGAGCTAAVPDGTTLASLRLQTGLRAVVIVREHACTSHPHSEGAGTVYSDSFSKGCPCFAASSSHSCHTIRTHPHSRAALHHLVVSAVK